MIRLLLFAFLASVTLIHRGHADPTIEALNQFGSSVFLVYPEGSDEPTGVATLVHKEGYFVTTQHATNWDQQHRYFLKRPGDSSGIFSGREILVARISTPPENYGYISILEASDWNSVLAPEHPRLCLTDFEKKSFTAIYLMFLSEDLTTSARELVNKNGRIEASGGVLPNESGSLVLRRGQDGVGVVEAHIDNDIVGGIGSYDELRRYASEAEVARILSFTDYENFNALRKLPEAQETIDLRSALRDEVLSVSNILSLLNSTDLQNSLDAFRVIETLMDRKVVCSRLLIDKEDQILNVYLGAHNLAERHCAEGIAATFLSQRHAEVLLEGANQYCASIADADPHIDADENGNASVSPTDTRDTSDPSTEVLNQANALAKDVLQTVLTYAKEAKDRDKALIGAMSILEMARSSDLTSSGGDPLSDLLSKNYLLSGKLALLSPSVDISSKVESLLATSMELKPNAEAAMLLATNSKQTGDFEKAREYLELARELDHEGTLNSEIVLLAGELSEELEQPGGGAGSQRNTGAETIVVASINNNELRRMQELSDDFTQKTGHSIEWVTLEQNQLRQRVTTDIATKGGQFDVMTIGMYETPIWAENGWLVPLDDLPVDYDVDDIIPSIRGGLSVDGVLYAAPFYGESSLMMYRTDLFEEYGLEMPEAPTWDFVANAARELTERDNQTYGICLRGRAGWADNMALLTAMANSFGARLFDEDWNPQFDSTEWNDTLSFYVELMNDAGPPNASKYGFNENLNLFQNGKCAMWVDSTFAPTLLTDLEGSTIADNVGYALAPSSTSEQPSSWLWAWSLAIPSGTQKVDAAIEFVEWATSKEYTELVAKNEGWESVSPGTRISLYQQDEYNKIPFAQTTLKSLLAADPQKPTSKPVPYVGVQFATIPEFPSIAHEVGTEFSAALDGLQSIDEALRNAQARSVEAMKSAGYN